jgi:hypothetical protein
VFSQVDIPSCRDYFFRAHAPTLPPGAGAGSGASIDCSGSVSACVSTAAQAGDVCGATAAGGSGATAIGGVSGATAAGGSGATAIGGVSGATAAGGVSGARVGGGTSGARVGGGTSVVSNGRTSSGVPQSSSIAIPTSDTNVPTIGSVMPAGGNGGGKCTSRLATAAATGSRDDPNSLGHLPEHLPEHPTEHLPAHTPTPQHPMVFSARRFVVELSPGEVSHAFQLKAPAGPFSREENPPKTWSGLRRCCGISK